MQEVKHLRDWLKEYKPGEVTLIRDNEFCDEIFTPYYIVCGRCYGITSEGVSINYSALTVCWSLYTPPKKKVKKWQWASETYKTATKGFYTEDAVEDLLDNYPNKLPWTEIEVDHEG